MLLFDRDEKQLGKLKYTLVANHSEEINGEDILEFTTLDSRVNKGFRVLYKSIYGYWNEFIIKGIEEIKGSDGIQRYVYCESSFYETFGDYIDDKRPSGDVSVALSSALQTSRWEIGITDNLGSNSTNFYHISVKEAVQKVAKTWNGEIRTRVIIAGKKISHRYVDILNKRGNDLGKRFTYTKDIKEISKEIHREDVVTALYGYGKGEELDTGGYGRRISFADINGGKAYVENNSARLIWGRNNPDGTKSHVFDKVDFDDVEDKQELLDLTLEKLQEISIPLVTYKAKVIDLRALGFEHEGVELGDEVVVIDKDFEPEIRIKARVIKLIRDILEPENTEIILGNFIPDITDSLIENEKYIDNFRNKEGIWDRSNIINGNGTINANILNDLVDELNTKMNSQGGYVYISEDGKGLTTYDKPIDQNPTMAIQILGGAFRIAGDKLPNGEWNWRTFGTGEGFVADLITTGTLDAGLIKAGVLISHDSSSYIDMVDGSFNFKDKLKWINDSLVIEDGIVTIDKDKVRVNHLGTGEYSEIRADGFVRKWANGEARYLNDIYLHYEAAGTGASSTATNLIRITLPSSFAYRTDLKFILAVSDIAIAGTSSDPYGTVVYSNTLSNTILEIVNKNINSTNPYVDVRAYVKNNIYTPFNNDYDIQNYSLGFVLMVVGGGE